MLSIGNKKYRNLQEQVAYNTECIQELAEAVDGITLEDKLVIIANDSGTFTEKDMTVLNGPLAFISDGSKVWLKQSETPSEFVFKAIDIVATEVGGTHFNVGGTKIVVTRATRAYATSDDVIITTFNKTQIEALLSGKADLSGANFTGAITAPTITEIMSGYSVEGMGTGWTPVYVGAVKTGNKLTLVICGQVTPTSQTALSLGNFKIPADVGAKLIPYQLGAELFLDNKAIHLFSTNTNAVQILADCQKTSNTTIRFALRFNQNVSIGTTYLFRYEITFLLSDNLAQ